MYSKIYCWPAPSHDFCYIHTFSPLENFHIRSFKVIQLTDCVRPLFNYVTWYSLTRDERNRSIGHWLPSFNSNAWHHTWHNLSMDLWWPMPFWQRQVCNLPDIHQACSQNNIIWMSNKGLCAKISPLNCISYHLTRGVQIVMPPRSPASVPELMGMPSNGNLHPFKWPGFVVYHVNFF